MNPSIFSREIKSNLTYTLIWTGGFLVGTVPNILGSVLPLRSAGKEYDVLAALVSSFGNNIMNLGPIFAMILGSLVISKEQDEKTIEFLLSHPITRGEIAVSKILAYTVSVLFANVVLVAAGLVLLAALGPSGHALASFLSLSLDLLLLMYAFGAAGMLLSMFITKGGAVVGYSIGIPLFLALLFLLQSSGNRVMVTLSYLSPHRYVDVALIMTTGRVDVPFVVAAALVAAGLLTASVATYRRKEFAV